MQTAFETIRALKTRFTVVKNSSDEFAFTADVADIACLRREANDNGDTWNVATVSPKGPNG